MGILQNRTLGGVLILAGTAIGAGMLALPITTGPAGFGFASLLCLCAFLGMSFTVFLLLELILASKRKDANLISMVGDSLGSFGQLVAWVSCLLLLYSVAAAYMTAGGGITFSALKHLGITLADEKIGACLFLAILGGISLLQTKFVDYFNRFLMICLILAFFFLLLGAKARPESLVFEAGNPKYIFAAFPVVFLSFTCHPVFPSIVSYFKRDIHALKKVILFGCLLPLIFYAVWQVIVIGNLSLYGENGLIAIGHATYPVNALTAALESGTAVNFLNTVVPAFSFFALATSFLAVSLSLMDFIADGLSKRLHNYSKSISIIATFLPPFLFAMFYPSGFIIALGYAGVFVAILYIILPVLMALKLRKESPESETLYRAPGGNLALFLAFLAGICVIVFQVASTFGLLPTP